MMSPVQPPRVAIWMVRLFTPDKEAESIIGDLLEEFRYFTNNSGVSFARKWCWRQSLNSVLHLFGSAIRQFWRSIVVVAVAGFFLLRFVGELFEHMLFAVLRKYQVADHHFGIYVLCATYGAEIAHVIGVFLAGFVVALLAKGKEMFATLTLSIVLCGLAIIASGVMLVKNGDDWLVWRLLPWSFADCCTIAVAGAIVRTRRLRRLAINLHITH